MESIVKHTHTHTGSCHALFLCGSLSLSVSLSLSNGNNITDLAAFHENISHSTVGITCLLSQTLPLPSQCFVRWNAPTLYLRKASWTPRLFCGRGLWIRADNCWSQAPSSRLTESICWISVCAAVMLRWPSDNKDTECRVIRPWECRGQPRQPP